MSQLCIPGRAMGLQITIALDVHVASDALADLWTEPAEVGLIRLVTKKRIADDAAARDQPPTGSTGPTA